MNVRPVTYRDVYSLAMPIAGVQLAGVALTTTDVIMLRPLGVTAIAGGGLAMQLYNQIRTMCVGMVTACGNLVAEADAINDPVVRGRSLRQVLRSSIAVGTATATVGVVCIFALAGTLLLLPMDSAVASITLGMAASLAPGLFPMVWFNVLRHFAVGMRRPGSLLAVTLVSIAVNAGLNLSLLYLSHTLGGGTALSVAAIGLSTTLVQVFTLSAFLRLIRRDTLLAQYVALLPRREDADTIKVLLKLGFPVSLTYGSEAAISTIAGIVLGILSPVVLAAHTVVNQLAYIVYQVCIGFSHGGSVLLSRVASTGRAVVWATSKTVLYSVWAYLGVVGLVWVSLGRYVLWPFLGATPSETLQVATLLLYLAVAQQFCKGTQNVLVGLLRGVKDTKSGLQATVWGYWVVGVPALLLLGVGLRWQGYGVWLGLILGFATTTFILLRRLQLLTNHKLLEEEK